MGARKLFIVEPGGAMAFGLTPAERLARQCARLGIELASTPEDADVLLRGDHVYGGAVVRALAEAVPGTVLLDATGRAIGARVDGASRPWALAAVAAHAPATALPAEARAVEAAGLAGAHDMALRKKAPPLVMAAGDGRSVERALFRDAYKGVTDIVTKHVWPPIALPLTRWCAARGVTPNQVTLVGAALMLLAFWLFWNGQFGPGLVAAWAMTLLDTVDGKLARVTLRSSPLGNVLDHGIDLVHPPFWYWAWAVGLAARGMPLEDGGLTLAVVIGGYVLQRLQEGLFIWLFGMEIHVWRPFDSYFRLITARRNPNLVILTVATLLGAPREGLIAVAVWTAVSVVVHSVRLVQALAARRAGDVNSWLVKA